MDIKSDSLKEALKTIVADSGTEILKNPNKLNAILRDLCPKESNEIDVIVNLSKNHMFDELTDSDRNSYQKVTSKAVNYASAYYADSLVHRVEDVLAYTFGIKERITVGSESNTVSHNITANTPHQSRISKPVMFILGAAVIGGAVFAMNQFHLFGKGNNNDGAVLDAEKTSETEEKTSIDNVGAGESEIDNTAAET